MIQHFADHGGVRIEYFLWEPEVQATLPPVMLVPGLLNSARCWVDDPAFVGAIRDTGPRRVLAVSLRGRGESDVPETGWGPEEHIGDIRSVLRQEGIGQAYLIGWSMGGAYAIGYALTYPGEVLGVAIGDFYPLVPDFSEAWAREVAEHPESDDFSPVFPLRVAAEGRRVEYTSRLGELEVPLLVLRGTGEGALLSAEGLRYYDAARRGFLVEVDGGHYVFGHPLVRVACAELVAGRLGTD